MSEGKAHDPDQAGKIQCNYPSVCYSTPSVTVLCLSRAHRQIHNAAQHPVELDKRQADAVEARMILDLKVGAAFTRLQTLILQSQVQQVAQSEGVVSYGTVLCEFPSGWVDISSRSLSIPYTWFCGPTIHSCEGLPPGKLLVYLPLPDKADSLSRRGRN